MLIAAAIITACSTSSRKASPSPLSADEIALVRDSDSLMRVLTVFEPSDSLVLRTRCEDFTDEDLQSDLYRMLAAKMVFTVTDSTQDGVGIAGPQIGLSRRVIAVMRLDKEGEPFEVYPNVRLDSLWGEVTHGPEGCLSIPGWRGNVPRYSRAIVSYTDPQTLMTVRDTVKDYVAIIFQHETDHLDGILYTDRADTVFAR